MPTYFVASGGSNTSPYDTWAKAATSLQTALTAASSNGDVVVIQYDGVPAADAGITADTTWTIGANISIISSTNTGTSTVTPTAMGTGNWLGTDTGAFMVRLFGAFRYSVYGVTLRNGGAATDDLIVTAIGCNGYWKDCYFWLGATGATSRILVSSGNVAETKNTFDGCTFRWGSTGHGFNTGEGAFFYNCDTAAAAGSTPTVLIRTAGSAPFSGTTEFDSCDLKFSTALIENQTSGRKVIKLSNCVLPSGAVLLASQTTYSNDSQAEVFAYDCAFGDIHYAFGHYAPSGQTEAVTAVTVSDGAEFDGTNKVSWAITTSASVSLLHPYVTPWIETYRGAVSTTPSIEGLRINNATVAQNDEVWAEFSYKGTASSVRHTFVSDAMAYGGTPANQTSAKTYADWTATPATDAGDSVFKLDVAAFTPSEVGMLRARVCVGEPSITVYIDPKIRT